MVYTDPDEVPWSAYLALGGIFAVIVAALLPWFTQNGDPTTGLAYDDGYTTMGVALATLALGAAFEWGIVARLGGALASVVTIAVGYNAWDQITDYPTHEPKLGLYLTVLGGLLLLIAVIWGSVDAYTDDGDTDGVA
ncbi:hypothetical protein [Salinarchaeum laminariae]|uniref:hypothetical protein n=1 Tax=Salinarchaeum laminariae TaxID=869888 RepID=UPI0020C00662|nr:hypothetical protein [Salinarchaeum laminariae]